MSQSAANIDRFPGVIGTFMGRDALALAAKILHLSSSDTVLLPSYLCNEVVKPFLGKCRVEFYALQPGLTIDLDMMRSRLKLSRVRALVMINYFGFLDPQRQELKKICAEHGTILVEDCALSLLTEGSGETGDLTVYSFRKTLPVRDGGGLKANGSLANIPVKFRPQIVSNVLSLCILGKQSLGIRTELLSRSGLSADPALKIAETPKASEQKLTLPMSSFTRRGIQHASFPDIIGQQRKDFIFWRDWTANKGCCIPIYDSLPAGVCPLGFPVKIKNRNEVRQRLQDCGVYLKVHWRMPAAIGADFADSHALSAQMLTLPVYPELGSRELAQITRIIGQGQAR
jgi:perosamine synthetase